LRVIEAQKGFDLAEPRLEAGTTLAVYVGLARTVHTEIRRIQIRRITVSVYGNFRPYPYPYDRTWILADRLYTPYVRSKPYMCRIWTVFAGGAVRFPATAVLFAFFFNILSRASSY